MARKKKPEPPSNTGGWLNTYADMVTLLLCFFVLMYTASTPDEAKMQWIIQSFSELTGSVVNKVVMDPAELSMKDDEEFNGPDFAEENEGDVIGVPGDAPRTFDDLFNWVTSIFDDNGLGSSTSVSASNGKLNIRFDSDIMFEGNSYKLLPEGRKALNTIIPGIKAVNDYIGSVRVEGHTSPLPDGAFNGIDDWTLSSMRAVSVVNFLDYNSHMVDSEKFEVSGLGQYSPFYSVDDPELNAKNRRVELVITRNSFGEKDTAVMVDILKYDYDLAPNYIGDGRLPPPVTHDKRGQAVNKIIEKYGNPYISEPDDEGDSKPLEPIKSITEWGAIIPAGLPTLDDFPAPLENEGGDADSKGDEGNEENKDDKDNKGDKDDKDDKSE